MGYVSLISGFSSIGYNTAFSSARGGETAGSVARNSYGGETAGSVASSSTGGSSSGTTSCGCSFSAVA